MEAPKMSQDELVEKLKQQVALENIELLLTVSSNYLLFLLNSNVSNLLQIPNICLSLSYYI